MDISFYPGNFKKKFHLGDLGVDGRLMLKRFFNK
jgi:hypothetical protein